MSLSALALCAVGASSCESRRLLAGVGVPLCRADAAMWPAAPGQDRAASCSAAFPPLPCFRGSMGGVCSRQMKGAGWYWIFFIEVPVDELAAFLLRKVFKRLFTHLDIFTAFITQLHPGVFRLFIL